MQGSHLHKQLGFLDVFCIACGAMISSGIFILPGVAFNLSGPFVFLSYFIAGILALLGTLSIIELATAMPKAGGDYFFINRSLGPMAGTISGLLSWFALSLKSAFAVFGISELLYLTFQIPILISAVSLCVLFVIINIVGVKAASRLEVILVIGLFALMIWFIVGGIPEIIPSHFVPALPHGLNSLISTAGFVFVSFGGLLNIASISEEVKNPTKNIPRAMIGAVIVISIFYSFMLVATVGLLPAEILSETLTPIADAAQIFAGRPGFIIISIAALLAFVTTANAGILSASRYPLALSEDNLLPLFIRRTIGKQKAPVVAIILTALLIGVALFFNLEILVKFASVVILTTYIFTNVAVIILRESNIQNYRPTYKTPLYPLTQIVSIILFSLLIIDMGAVAIEVSVVVIVLASLCYFLYGRKKQSQEFALLHLIERIVNRKLTSNTLESELREIITHRDELQKDRFHLLLEKSPVHDVTESMTVDTFFKYVAKKYGQPLGLAEDNLFSLLRDREAESSTAITPFIAIPHIVVPGEKRFAMCIVRNKAGIKFSAENDDVKAIFILAGSQDERNFHLQALAAIAQIVHHREFSKLWLEAKNEDQLKDILLLAERSRQ